MISLIGFAVRRCAGDHGQSLGGRDLPSGRGSLLVCIRYPASPYGEYSLAIYLLVGDKGALTALCLSQQMGVSWIMAHRGPRNIRKAMGIEMASIDRWSSRRGMTPSSSTGASGKRNPLRLRNAAKDHRPTRWVAGKEEEAYHGIGGRITVEPVAECARNTRWVGRWRTAAMDKILPATMRSDVGLDHQAAKRRIVLTEWGPLCPFYS